jgi:hypothetical protein
VGKHTEGKQTDMRRKSEMAGGVGVDPKSSQIQKMSHSKRKADSHTPKAEGCAGKGFPFSLVSHGNQKSSAPVAVAVTP